MSKAAAKPVVAIALHRRPLGRRCGGCGRLKEATMLNSLSNSKTAPGTKGRLTGQKRPLKPKDVWAIQVRLQLQHRRRDLALFNLAIDSKLRGCDLVRLQLNDVCVGGQVRDRTTIIQKKTGRPVQFEITEQTRASIRDWRRGATGTVPLPQPPPGAAASIDAAVCANRSCLGRQCRARQHRLRDAFDAADEGGADL